MQSLAEMAAIPPVGRNRPAVSELGVPTEELTQWIQLVSQGAQTLENDGTPETFVVGYLGWECLDITNKVFYKKSTNGGKTGWIALN